MSKSHDKRVAALRGRDLVGALIQAAFCNGAGPCPDLRREQDAAEQALRAELDGLRKGHARYEYVRTLNSLEFSKMWQASNSGGGRFDDLVDAAMRGEG